MTPYYLSLLSIRVDGYDDSTIRSYVIYSEELVENFGQIRAWEKEDVVEPGKPNAAGWLLPNATNIHRRYPEVAIFYPGFDGTGLWRVVCFMSANVRLSERTFEF